MSDYLFINKSSLKSCTSSFNENIPNTLATFETFGNEKYENTADYNNLIQKNEEVIQETRDIVIESQVSDESIEQPQIIAYFDHPVFKNEKKNINIDIQKKHIAEDKQSWDLITRFYLGSLTVVGLFILFRVVQRSK